MWCVCDERCVGVGVNVVCVMRGCWCRCQYGMCDERVLV